MAMNAQERAEFDELKALLKMSADMMAASNARLAKRTKRAEKAALPANLLPSVCIYYPDHRMEQDPRTGKYDVLGAPTGAIAVGMPSRPGGDITALMAKCGGQWNRWRGHWTFGELALRTFRGELDRIDTEKRVKHLTAASYTEGRTWLADLKAQVKAKEQEQGRATNPGASPDTPPPVVEQPAVRPLPAGLL